MQAIPNKNKATMTPEHLKNLIVRDSESGAVALWKTVKSLASTSLVLDGQGRLVGLLTAGDFPVHHPDFEALTAGDICNRQGLTIAPGPDFLLRAKAVFEKAPSILMVPVVDQDRRPVDVVFKFQAFYEDYFREPDRFHSRGSHVPAAPGFPYMFYAHCLWRAAAEARRHQYPRISAIEFGVASGNGLICLEWHARAIAAIFQVDIEVYGFDSGQGLPPSDLYQDIPYFYGEAQFKMESLELLRGRLSAARLVLGDIAETAPVFFDLQNPAPIGAMLVDVDIYSSTVPVLEMLTGPDRFFLPRVQMYFDDISHGLECIGESLAIKEFNAAHELIKISPEDTFATPLDGCDYALSSYLHRVKEAHMFSHPLYKTNPGRADAAAAVFVPVTEFKPDLAPKAPLGNTGIKGSPSRSSSNFRG